METTRKTRVRLSDSGSEFYGRRTLSYMWVMMDTNGSFLFSDDNSSRLASFTNEDVNKQHGFSLLRVVCRAGSCAALTPTEVFLRALACGFTLQRQRTLKQILES